VVTYDDFGFYGHPDHIKAHHITLAALDVTGLSVKLYCPTIRRSRLAEFGRHMAQAGVEVPEVDESRFGSLDADVAATIDCRHYAGAKRAALLAHASQSDNIFFLGFPLPDFTELFGTEEFIRLRDSAGSPTPEDDLFAGL
jgi:LmbE family N-acetylglucosaminyl deacetylase